MRKYWEVFKISWQNGLAYPISVLFWRIRQFLPTFMSLTIWSAIFSAQQSTFGYTQNQMITYIFLVGFLQSIILATVMHNLSEQIYSGKISYEFIKPINVYLYLASQDIADKIKNFGFIVLESTILYFLFKPEIVFPDAVRLFFFFTSAILGAVLLYLLMLLFGSIGFWSNETWGPRFLFFIFIEFTAGKFFPINIMPELFQKVIFLTPFPYFSYVQTQIFIGKFGWAEVLRTHLLLAVWVMLLAFIVKAVWAKGLKEYGAMGH